MPVLVRRFSFLVYFLSLAMLCPAVSLRASVSPQKIMVMGLPGDPQVRPLMVSVTESMRRQFESPGKRHILSQAEAQRFIKMHLGSLEVGPQRVLNDSLKKAKNLYKTFSFNEAIALLESSIGSYRQNPDLQGETFSLIEAYLMLGNVSLGAGKLPQAREAFREAIRLDPGRKITQRKYPPKTVQEFLSLRSSHLEKLPKSQVTITSSPKKARVFINGIEKGVTPLKLSEWTAGEHFILIQKDGYQKQVRRFHLKGKKQREKISLKKISKKSRLEEEKKAIEIKDESRLSSLGTLAAKTLGLSQVVFVSVQGRGKYRIAARIYDHSSGGLSRIESLEIRDIVVDQGWATRKIARDLTRVLEKSNKKLAKESTFKPPKKKKSFLKSPILWGLVGALVLGGATGAFLMTRGGGGSDEVEVNVNGSVGRTP